MWVYGNNDGHLTFSKFRDSNGKSFEVEYLDENVGVNWTGWKYIEGKILCLDPEFKALMDQFE